MNRRNEKWLVLSGCAQTQAFILLTQSSEPVCTSKEGGGGGDVLIRKAKYWALLEIL